MIALLALVFCLLGSAVLMLLTFLLLPWAKQRMGSWSLALIPLSTFAGTYLGWMVMWVIFS